MLMVRDAEMCVHDTGYCVRSLLVCWTRVTDVSIVGELCGAVTKWCLRVARWRACGVRAPAACAAPATCRSEWHTCPGQTGESSSLALATKLLPPFSPLPTLSSVVSVMVGALAVVTFPV
ncbi:hypothetical protein E2C01_071412 [Portunus trituberculatus]|uniref:Uncharacterized protein n=1 Tax=Portunus trituberculatus TaxID=210409 RepID=A0A5B7I4D6_PORTR|nr:hypothetical protein [Portunus trituberculatus]